MQSRVTRREICYLALAVCILTNLTPEQAFERVAPESGGRVKHNDNDIIEMIKLKKTMTYAQIGQIFNISANTVYRKIKKYNQTKMAS